MTRKPFLLILIILTLYSCALIPCEAYSDLKTVEYKPKDSELIGEYYPDQQTIDNISGFSKNSRIILNNDKKFTIENFPESTFDFDSFYSGPNKNESAIGKWGAYYSEYTANLSISVDYGERNENGKFDFGTSWQIFKKDNKYTICVIVGDPDECAVIRLVKK